ncbi:MAG: hypothetical protein IJ848_00920 [Alphaproteobacteria bacterium]|nr:hypothetical protein [Alphaproteobacteria bacterium]
MIPFKYYCEVYKRYIKISIRNKKQSIKDWFTKPREEKYKYYNPDISKNNTNYSATNIISSAVFGVSQISSNMNDKIYCKDMNRQMHYNKGRLKSIVNTLESIFNEPFERFSIQNKTSKSNEELAVEINKSIKKIVLYFLLGLAIIFFIVMAFSIFSNGVFFYETSNVTTTPPKPSNSSGIFYGLIFITIGIYLAITLIVSFIFYIVTFICLWKFINKNTTIVYW